MKHTKGPWNIRRRNIEGFKTAYVNLDDSSEIDVQLANARLIAAAPELLEALKTLVEMWTNFALLPDDQKNAVKVAYAVITKAEGGAK